MTTSKMGADFGGYATKAGLKCSDGRTITAQAFAHMFEDSTEVTVPLVWHHDRTTPENVLGHALLQLRDDGVYAYGFFNDSTGGKTSKTLVEHQDVKSLSIYANNLVEKSKVVMHGVIREVSLVLSGANPGAFIDFVSIQHSDGETELTDDAIISTMLPIELEHSDKDETEEVDEVEHADAGATVQDVYDTLDDDQKALLHIMVSAAMTGNTTPVAAHSAFVEALDDEQRVMVQGILEHAKNNSSTSIANSGDEGITHTEGSTPMTNVFEAQALAAAAAAGHTQATLSHDQMKTILDDGRKGGSFKDAFMAHAADYGITNIEVLFPDAQAINSTPEWITRRMEWVENLLNSARKLPFSKVKSMSADLTADSARAKGYIKGNMKKEQFFEIAQRETGPKTIYKKQKLDRDDIIDATEFDVVAWLWVEMRFMVREEVARAILVGDGREVDDPDKISETAIRPISTDDSFYTDVLVVPENIEPEALVEAILRGRSNYKGKGQPTAYLTQDVLTDMLLVRDKMGRRLYRTVAELAAELQVSDLVAVDVMEDAMRDGSEVLIILVNMSDYSIGSTKGGELTQFDDFDIDFNQYKYLIETRLSGALTLPKTAQVVVRASGGVEVTPAVPAFNAGTGVITIPTTVGVQYKNKDTGVVLTAGAQTALAPGAQVEVQALAIAGYYLPHNFDNDWNYKRDA